MTYIQTIIESLTDQLDDCEPELIRLYALLALVRGKATNAEHVHDAWAVWRSATSPNHPSIVPFVELTEAVQALDDPYVEAIRKATP